jgi:hypothetical protein
VAGQHGADAIIVIAQNVETQGYSAVDLRKWLAGKLMPRQYGDQPQSVSINTTSNIMVISEEKQRELQEIRRKLLLGQK